ncbi:hypothetical protein [Persephonella sp.]
MEKRTLVEILEIGNRAVKKAQMENIKMGIPNVYCINNILYFKLPDGTITTEIPEVYREKLSPEYLRKITH